MSWQRQRATLAAMAYARTNLPPPTDHLGRRIARATRLARLASMAERAWPRLVVVASLVGLFLILSWLGLWPLLNDWVRLALVGFFGLLLCGALVWMLRVPRVSSVEALRRVERESGLTDRPLAALVDAPFEATSRESQALWQAHRRQMTGRIGRLKSGVPDPRTERLDRYGLRSLIALGLVVAFFAAGPERGERVLSAFAPPTAAPGVPVRIDVWATPPAYTGMPPRALLSLSDAALPPVLEPASLPVGSRLTVLASVPDLVTARFLAAGGSGPRLLERKGSEGMADAATGSGPLTTVLDSDGILEVGAPGLSLPIPLGIVPDTPPTIALLGEPEASAVGALELGYTAQDDYGVTQAGARFAPANPELSDADWLIPPPSVDLVLPGDPRGGEARTIRDLSAHPWAGSPVLLTLFARDGAGQTFDDEPRRMVLPGRPFSQDLARALVEQRRNLAVDRAARRDVLTALEALALAPETFMADAASDYLALTVTTQRLRLATTDEDLIEVVDLLWQLALQVEDGDLSLAAERLREAEEQLAEALERGADGDELAALMEELRQAFEAYMQALAERLMDGEFADMPLDMPLQSLNPQSMQDMMDRIEELAELGAEDAARQLLEDLREQLEALRGGQAMQNQEMSEAQRQLQDAMRNLQAIAREQQRLLDETFPFSSDAETQQARPAPEAGPGDAPDAGEETADERRQRLGDLSDMQQALREELESLMDQLSDLGLDPDALGEAGEAMDGASDQLGRGDANGAMTDQGRALEALRNGAQSMMEQLAEQGSGEGEGQARRPGEQPGQGSPRLRLIPGDGQRGTDPLGRPQRATQADDDRRVRIPDDADVQRARDILDEIQRRLSEPTRPLPERDYLDRLIERF